MSILFPNLGKDWGKRMCGADPIWWRRKTVLLSSAELLAETRWRHVGEVWSWETNLPKSSNPAATVHQCVLRLWQGWSPQAQA